MKRSIIFALLIVLALVFFYGCKTDEPPLSDTEASQMIATAMAAVSLEISNTTAALSPTKESLYSAAPPEIQKTIIQRS